MLEISNNSTDFEDVIIEYGVPEYNAPETVTVISLQPWNDDTKAVDGNGTMVAIRVQSPTVLVVGELVRFENSTYPTTPFPVLYTAQISGQTAYILNTPYIAGQVPTYKRQTLKDGFFVRITDTADTPEPHEYYINSQLIFTVYDSVIVGLDVSSAITGTLKRYTINETVLQSLLTAAYLPNLKVLKTRDRSEAITNFF